MNTIKLIINVFFCVTLHSSERVAQMTRGKIIEEFKEHIILLFASYEVPLQNFIHVHALLDGNLQTQYKVLTAFDVDFRSKSTLSGPEKWLRAGVFLNKYLFDYLPKN